MKGRICMAKINKKTHTGNNAMMIIITIFWAIVVIGMAWQTWGFIDWLLPNSAWLMKGLVLVNFDIAAFIFFCIRNFFGKITKGGYVLASWGAALDGLLSFLTTVFWFVIQYILKYDVSFQDGLVTTMYVVAILAFVLNALFAYFFVEIEWRFYHPITFVDVEEEDEDEEVYVPPKPIIREVKGPSNVALAREESAPKSITPPKSKANNPKLEADKSITPPEITVIEEDDDEEEEPVIAPKKKLPRRALLGAGRTRTKS